MAIALDAKTTSGSVEKPKRRVLVIEDDRSIRHAVCRAFVKADYDVSETGNGSVANHMLATHEYDLIVLDLMLPGASGLEILQQLRDTSPTPVIVVTARALLEDRVAGLELGADDYLVKPFEMAELMARAHAIARRIEGTITNTSSAPLRHLMVEVRLVDGEDNNQAVLVVPAGAAFENTHLDAIRDEQTLRAAVDAAVLRTANFELPAGQSTRFSAVFVPSDELEPTGLTPVVRPVSAEQSGAASCWAPLTLGPPANAESQGVAGSAAADGSGAVAEGSATDGSSAGPAADGSMEGSMVPAEASGEPAVDGDAEAP
jgi:DNA-binding response OmpR family regulator